MGLWPHDLRWRRGAIWLGIFVIVAGVGAVLFMVSGVFNVAANVRHFQVTERIISFVLARSVAVHSDSLVPGDLTDEGLVRLGARHFATGCAPCHGTPGEPATPIVHGMYPAPPPLDHAADKWTDAELAWIVENGFKMTGMPAWPGKGRGDEVWPLVSFIKALPGIDAAEYRTLTTSAAAGRSPLTFSDFERTVDFCAGCHGDENAAPVDGSVPPLHIQTPDYLARALVEYRRDIRESGMMEPIAAALDDGAILELSRRLGRPIDVAESGRPRAFRDGAGAAQDEGASLVRDGSRQREIPACSSCHNQAASPRFPRLEGLPQDYIETQLRLFRSGVRGSSGYGAVMAAVAQRLSDSDIEAAAAHFAAAAKTRRQTDSAESRR